MVQPRENRICDDTRIAEFYPDMQSFLISNRVNACYLFKRYLYSRLIPIFKNIIFTQHAKRLREHSTTPIFRYSIAERSNPA